MGKFQYTFSIFFSCNLFVISKHPFFIDELIIGLLLASMLVKHHNYPFQREALSCRSVITVNGGDQSACALKKDETLLMITETEAALLSSAP